MAQVPYSGVTTVAPSTEGQPTLNIPAPVEAFGAGFGRALEKAGDEIFQRAVAIQQINNQTMASDAATNFIENSAKLRADYLNSRGSNAVNGLDSHLKAIRELQEQHGQGLNPAALRQYDNETRRVVAWNMMSAATHAASEGKQNALTSIASKRQALHDQLKSIPDNDPLYNDTIEELHSLEQSESALRGYDPEVAEQRFNSERSKLASDRAIALARTDPVRATKMSRRDIDGGVIIGDDIAKTQQSVRHEMDSTGARLISNDILSGASPVLGSGTVTMDQAKMAIGSYESGNDYNAIGPQTKHGRALGKYQVMEEYLPEFLKEAGMPAMTGDAFLHNPAAQEQLFEFKFGKYMKDYGSFNEAASRWFTGKSVAEAQASGAKDIFGTDVNRYLQKTNAYLAGSTPLKALLAKADTMAVGQSDDPLFRDYVRDRVTTDYNKARAVERDDTWRNNNAIAGVLTGIDTPDNKVPTTVEEFRASPQGDAAWLNADNVHRAKILKALMQNSKGDRGFTEASFRTYMTYRGMAISDDPEDRRKFLEMDKDDIISLPIPFSARASLINEQRRLKEKSEADPRVTHAMSILRDAGLLSGIVDKKIDEDDYHLFTALIQNALETFQNQYKTPAKQKDIIEMGKALLYRKVTDHWYGQSEEEPAYRQPPPDDEREKIIERLKAQGFPPTELLIQGEWARSIYMAVINPQKVPENPVPKIKAVSGNFVTRGIDRLSDAIDNASRNMKAQEAQHKAEEEAIRQHQIDLLTERSRKREAEAGE